ncbi:hypothetical protein BT96DRAFT_950796 [Gymnopus androsaceus JB14]|uniref:Uncharacterized protein n=1 Tax=Gymnopus androsaceus JB14 TaxID=1447944 RepID=A0A6A4GF17_9AGAR|nr:hypothetical protein BT96DRAFT_950796 [Gymnopus androsaceus JB14]
MDDFTVLWDQYPSPFEPESADSEKWLGDARDWLEELAGFLKPPSYNPDKDLKELLILSKQEIDCPGDHVVTGEAVLKTLSRLGNWIELVFVHSTSLAEISKELMELKAWSTACKLIVSVWMDGWVLMDGQIDDWKSWYGWMDGWMDERALTDGWMDGLILFINNIKVEALMDGWTDGWIGAYGWMDGQWMNGALIWMVTCT